MRHGLVGTLLLGVGLALVPAHSMAAEPGEPGYVVEPGEAGYVIARGSFDPAPLCADVGPDCEVIANQIALAWNLAIYRVHGAANFTIRYRPHPECEPWTLDTWIEFNGVYESTDDSFVRDLVGTLESQMDLEYEMRADGECQHKTAEAQDTGTWVFEPLSDTELTGEAVFPNAKRLTAVDFTLDWTWQNDAPDGFFDQDSSIDPGTLSFFIDELVPGE